jgi:hypothetical protein
MRTSLVLAGVIVACGQDSKPEVEVVSRTEVNAIERRLDSLAAELLDVRLKASIASVRASDKGNTAIVDCADPGYAHVLTDVGVLLFRCEKAEPYLDGFRLHLQIGNPLVITLSGLKVNSFWSADSGVDSSAVNVTNQFYPGRWNPVKVNIGPIRAEQLRQLWLRLDVNQVRMR